MVHEHTPEAISQRLDEGPSHSYLRDWVYGGIDGAVTTFAVVAGVIGARLSPATILILGAANLVADGFSMAASNYLGTRTEKEEREHWEAFERRQIVHDPHGEREEIRQILIKKGFSGELLEPAVEVITRNSDKWIELMLAEEYGLPQKIRSPMAAALCTFAAFVLAGAVPLAPFVAGLTEAFPIACVLTAITFFAIGSFKSRWTIRSWWSSGLSTLAVGTAAALMAYFAGVLLKGVA